MNEAYMDWKESDALIKALRQQLATYTCPIAGSPDTCSAGTCPVCLSNRVAGLSKKLADYKTASEQKVNLIYDQVEMDEAIKQAKREAIPEGYQLVLIDLDEDTLDAMTEAYWEADCPEDRGAFNAQQKMLAAHKAMLTAAKEL